MKHRDQKQLEGRKASISAYTSTSYSITEGTQVRELKEGRNLEAELKQKPWKGIADWPAPHGLISMLSYTP